MNDVVGNLAAKLRLSEWLKWAATNWGGLTHRERCIADTTRIEWTN